jgi:hypothetical protein
MSPSHLPAIQQRPAYQKTRAEYEAGRMGIPTSAHRELVKLALISRKAVPAIVLADYPDLIRTSPCPPKCSIFAE